MSRPASAEARRVARAILDFQEGRSANEGVSTMLDNDAHVAELAQELARLVLQEAREGAARR